MGFLLWLEGTAYSEWIVAGLLGWPLMLSMHALGLAITVGIMFALSLRFLGFFKPISFSALGSLMAFAWIGIALNVFSGFSLFMAQASFYVTSIPFLTKITFVFLGIGHLYYTQNILRTEAAGWDAAGTVPQNGLILGVSALASWTLAVVGGRLIAYL